MCSVFITAWLTDGRLKDASTVTSQQNMQNIRLTFLHRTICEKQQNFLWNDMMADWKMHLQFTSPLGQNRQNKQDIRLTFLHTVHRDICEKTNKTLDRHQSVTVPKCFSGTGSGTYFRNRIIFRYWFLSLFSVQKFLVPIPLFIFGTKFSQYRFRNNPKKWKIPGNLYRRSPKMSWDDGMLRHIDLSNCHIALYFILLRVIITYCMI